MAEAVRVLLAVAQPVVGIGIRALLAREPDLAVVGETTNGPEAQRLCHDLQPDVLVLDLRAFEPAPFEALAALRGQCPEMRVLVVSARDEHDAIQRAVASGALGYLLKDDATALIVQAIRAAAQGSAYFSPCVWDKLAHPHIAALAPIDRLGLTDREQQLLHLLAEGKKNAEIARELKLGKQTVRNYAGRLYHKLDVHTHDEAVIWAREHGFGGR